ncbi:DNA adenine methylase [Curtobacterium poinsettiae]|uniref:DNA adenine methylase n=1 Tax=Curtobacterium poinsettiae TaxID=159612 RepID=UPI00217D04A4|nr:DNA adenine methylase [Curtobacterium flaccumfaciens]MCS6578701.1 DNA adenine methylase [Curtobacterium flaccumfaciens]
MKLDKNQLLLEARRTRRELRPFLRWAGSKRRLLPQLVPFLPDSFDSYFEPFLGGGSLATLLKPTHGVLSDRSSELIHTWRTVSESPLEVLRAIEAWPLEKETYYQVRGQKDLDAITSAARFIYLNRGAFNGLYRVNRQGSFNVPWGAPKSSMVVADGLLESIASWLREPTLQIRCSDFQDVISVASENDLVFADPPYHAVRPDGRDFRHYNHELFSYDDQVRLASEARAARDRGAKVLVTNSASEEIASLYSDFQVVELAQISTIAASSIRRQAVVEYLFVSR